MDLSRGIFLEISLSTPNLITSTEFYQSLGFTSLQILPVWPHPYAVFSDGSITLGLHQYPFVSPSLTYVNHNITAALAEHEAAGIVINFKKPSAEYLNEFGFIDSQGVMVTLLTASTYLNSVIAQPSQCGVFEKLVPPTLLQPSTTLVFKKSTMIVTGSVLTAPEGTNLLIL